VDAAGEYLAILTIDYLMEVQMPFHVVYDVFDNKRRLIMKENSNNLFVFYDKIGDISHKYRFLKTEDSKAIDILGPNDELRFKWRDNNLTTKIFDKDDNLIHSVEILDHTILESHFINNERVYYREEKILKTENIEIEFIDYHYRFDINDPNTLITRVFHVKEYENIREFTSGFDKWIFIKYDNHTIWDKYLNEIKYESWELTKE